MIYYVGTYRTENIAERDARGSVAEDVKIAYVASAIKKLGQRVTTLSVLSSRKRGFHKRKVCVIDGLETQVFLESFDYPERVLSKLGVIQRLIALFFYLAIHARRTDRVLVYNTQLFSIPIRLAKCLKGFQLILEVEEVFYLDDRNPVDVRRRVLEDALIAAADRYIFASDLLANRFSVGKDFAVVYGGYTIPPRIAQRRMDGNIHVVYAGGIDSLRRVDYAVKAFGLLPDGFRLHILGKGADQELESLKQEIEKVNCEAGYEKAEYVGCLYGQEYDAYLESCHIGLNMQSIGSSIEDVAYPSKISSYIGRGLTVVSGRLSSVVASPFAVGMQMYNASTPEEIAQAILTCKIQDYDTQTRLVFEAEKRFMAELERILNTGR